MVQNDGPQKVETIYDKKMKEMNNMINDTDKPPQKKPGLSDFGYLKQVGIEIPRQIVMTKDDWKDFYSTLARFKDRLLKRHGFHPNDIFHPITGEVVSHGKRSGRGS